MYAAVLRSAEGPYELEEIVLEDPAPDQVLVQLAGTGLCHTDTLLRAPGFTKLPVIGGHEGAGVVQEVGAAVRGIAVGDHVVLSFGSCGACHSCLGARPAYCQEFQARNMSCREPDGSTPARALNGDAVGARWFQQSSFATHALATARNVVVVDRTLPIDMLGPLGCAVQTGAGSVFSVLRVQPGTALLVCGAGAVGLSAVMAARVAGAGVVIAVDQHESRLKLARELGATHVVHDTGPGLTEQVNAITGEGVEYALDTTGVPEVITAAIGAVRPPGIVGLVGMQRGDLAVGPLDLGLGRTLVGIVEGDSVPQQLIPRLCSLWRRGEFPFDRMIRQYPLSEINEAERACLAGEVVKPIVLPGSLG
ncbi:NAD(P)-dependent alcohol dehydrogenase [Lentzea flava]|uniref:Alcohol dehydrogenase n=1 Tax=Lentzea flava TaxID=103732 RepID=A0ABQ2VJG2_9PSEU|nr:NAD(P)-dependent alcohol dehydrogenase [Lentzea flava]MCP2205380.1 aryl-alcohol dehydrogenase [Lentzea flava]GGU86367.1 alcohol dehydrogenase [Lentzea flava]